MVGRKPILSGEQVNERRSMLEKGAKVAALAREYGVGKQTVYSSVRGGLSRPPLVCAVRSAGFFTSRSG